MKHPVRDRLLLLLYALASLCAAAALIAFVFGQLTPDMLGAAAAKIQALPLRRLKIVLAVIAAVLAILGLSLVSAIFPPKKKRSSSFALQQNENGTVRISLKTIDALVQKCLGQHSELKVVTSSLFSDEETVRIDVHIVLLSDISMPLAISALQKQITKYIEACSGVNVREVRIFVDGAMTDGEKVAQSKFALPASILVEEPLTEEKADEADFAPVAEEMAAEETLTCEAEEAGAIEAAQTAEENVADQEEASAEEKAEEAAEEEPPAEEPAAEEDSPAMQDEIPAQEPAVERKKIFGLFSKK